MGGEDCANPVYYWSHVGECLAEAGGDIVSQATADGLQQVANAMADAVGTMIAAIGTIWVTLPTPDIRNIGGEGTNTLGQAPPMAAEFVTLLNWVMGICIVVAVGSLIVLGMSVMARRRDGESMLGGNRILLITGTVAVMMSAGAIVAAVLPRGAAPGVDGAVGWLQNSLFWWTAMIAIFGVLVSCGYIIWTQRAEGFTRILGGLLRLIVVSVAAAATIAVLTRVMDTFAVWLLSNSTSGCDVSSTADSCFGENIAVMLMFSSAAPLGAIAVIGLGFIIWLAGLVQVFLMVARTGILVVIAGVMPVAAAASMTRRGEEMLTRLIGWTLAFILYKPAAAIIYAVAFNLTGTNVWTDDGTGMVSIITGITLMVLALLTLPALMRLIVPAVAAVAGGAGGAGMLAMGGMAAAGAMELASGAVSNGSRGGGGAPAAPARSRSAGESGTGSAQVAMQNGAPSAGKAASSGAAAGAGGVAAGGGAAAGGAAAGGAAAAGGPAGIALVVGQKAAEGAKRVGNAAKSAANDAAGSSEPEQR